MRTLLAAGGVPPFFAEIAVLAVACAVVAYVCHRLHVTPIVSFLAAGALIGPHALGLVQDEALVEAAAEIGVVLLLFTIGVEFSIARLARIRRLIFIGGGLQVALVVAVVTGIAVLTGADWRSGVFTGFLVSLSSTAIVMKLLMDEGETNSEGGQAALGILIFQDLAVVAMVLLLPALAGSSSSFGGIALALGKAVMIVALVLLVARRFMPAVLEAVARTCSQEIFVLSVVAICFGTAFLTSLAGVSLSLGAFLAGLMVSESRFSELAFGEILPLQILFSATFFVSVGLLLDISFIVANPLTVLAVVVVVLVVKALASGLALRTLGYGYGAYAFTGLLLAQVGEFSFVLERSGREVGLFPAGMESGGPQAFIASTVVLMIATPFLGGAARRLRARSTRTEVPPSERVAAAEGNDGRLQGHVIIAGYGKGGRRLAHILKSRGVSFVVLTLSPDGAREAEQDGIEVVRGNYMRRHELTLAGAYEARLLVVADDDLETTQRVVRAARALSPDLPVWARTRYESEIGQLTESGAHTVIAEDLAGISQLIDGVLETLGASDGRPTGTADAARDSVPEDGRPIELSEAQRQSKRCAHAHLTKAVTPSAAGCEECLALGDAWVHLRICMTCGHVGCCDSSKNKHASRHARETRHPVAKSFEQGEDWAWCYEDRTLL